MGCGCPGAGHVTPPPRRMRRPARPRACVRDRVGEGWEAQVGGSQGPWEAGAGAARGVRRPASVRAASGGAGHGRAGTRRPVQSPSPPGPGVGDGRPHVTVIVG